MSSKITVQSMISTLVDTPGKNGEARSGFIETSETCNDQSRI